MYLHMYMYIMYTCTHVHAHTNFIVSSHTRTCTCTLECGCSGVVVHEIFDPLFSVSNLPAEREGQLLGHGETRVLPLCSLTLVVNKVDSLVGEHALLCGGEGGVEGQRGEERGREGERETGRQGEGEKRGRDTHHYITTPSHITTTPSQVSHHHTLTPSISQSPQTIISHPSTPTTPSSPSSPSSPSTPSSLPGIQEPLLQLLVPLLR